MKRDIRNVSRVLVFVLTCLIVGQSVFAAPAKTKAAPKENMKIKVEKLKSKTIAVGKVQRNKDDFKVGDISLPMYSSMNISYIQVSDLKQVGGNVFWDAATGKIVIYDLENPINENPTFEALAENATGYLGRDAVYINHQEIPAIFVAGKALVPAKWVQSLLIDKKSDPAKEELEEVEPEEVEPEEVQEEVEPEEVELEEVQAEEVEPEEVEADVEEPEVAEPEVVEPVEKSVYGINLWFNGKDYIEEPYDFSALKPGEFGYYKDPKYNDKLDYMYVGFVISEVDGIVNHDLAYHKAWLKNPTYYTIPKVVPPVVVPPVVPEKSLADIFPDTRVKGVMKYAAGGFGKGETVNVDHASSGKSYHLINKSGKIVTVPWGSVAIQKSPVTKEQATTAQIEAYINSKNFSSKTKYYVWTDIYRQRTYVFQGSKNNWKLIKNFLCSTGRDTKNTPVGNYTLNVRVPSFGANKGYLAKNAYGFIGTTYLYHSVIYDKTGKYLLNGWGNLGEKASSGCIRLAPEDSVWFYKTLPIGTGIFIN